MSEFPPSVDSPETSPTPPERVEEMRDRFIIISRDFKEWYEDEDNDSNRFQKLRTENFYHNCWQLQKAVSESLSLQGYQLQLVIGKRLIDAWIFKKNAMDLYTPVFEEIPPETAIDIELSQYWATGITGIDHPKPIEFYRDPRQLFLGGRDNRLIPASIIARTLHEDGQFRIIESKQPDQ
jgi:hypothetical protein